MTPKQTRPIEDLLNVVGARPQIPFTGRGIVEAYEADVITKREAQLLQQHSHRSFSSQKRALKESRPVTDEPIEKMRAQLDQAAARLGWLEADD